MLYVCSANIFFQSVACSFLLLMMSFDEQKFLIIMKFNLSTSLSQCFQCSIKGIIPSPNIMNTFSYVIIKKFDGFPFHLKT